MQPALLLEEIKGQGTSHLLCVWQSDPLQLLYSLLLWWLACCTQLVRARAARACTLVAGLLHRWHAAPLT